MMFYLSKIVWGLFQPSSLLIILFAGGAVMAWAGRTRAAIRLFASGAALYVIFGFSPLANWVMAPLEVRAKAGAAQSLDGAAGIIVLGGAIESATSLGGDAPHLNESGDRMAEALRLAASYPSLPVFFSGGKADLFPREDRDTEAALALRFFAAFNLTPPRVRFEDRSRNTFENAVETAKELQPKPGQKWILVTSAFHMPRAKALFEAQGFEILARPVDYRTNGFDGWWRPFPRASEGLRRLDLVVKEWVGLAMAWALGQLPARRTLSGVRGVSTGLCHNCILPYTDVSLSSRFPNPLG
jgi:uncharacterized SAM-binding protein YcdF (DUF218 family)